MVMPKNLTPEQQESWKLLKRARAREWQIQNKERAQERKRVWYLNNRELTIQRAVEHKHKKSPPNVKIELSIEEREVKRKNYMRQYYDDNKNIIISRWIDAKRNKYSKDPTFRLKEALRTRIRIALASSGYSKKSKTFNILGCEFCEFVVYIEKQFTDGMTWENQGAWHLDHKVPLALAKTESEIIRLNHFSNFQPLWAKDNFAKNRKMMIEFLDLREQLIGR